MISDLALRRLLLRGTRDPLSRQVLFDALLESYPAVMREVLADADALARRHRTSYVVYLHPNLYKSGLRRPFPAHPPLFPAQPALGFTPNRSDFALWPRGHAARRKPSREYGYVEIHRTRDYRDAPVRSKNLKRVRIR